MFVYIRKPVCDSDRIQLLELDSDKRLNRLHVHHNLATELQESRQSDNQPEFYGQYYH